MKSKELYESGNILNQVSMENDNLNTRLLNFEQELLNYVRSLKLVNEEQDLIQEILLNEIEGSSKIRLMNFY